MLGLLSLSHWFLNNKERRLKNLTKQEEDRERQKAIVDLSTLLRLQLLQSERKGPLTQSYRYLKVPEATAIAATTLSPAHYHHKVTGHKRTRKTKQENWRIFPTLSEH